MRGWTGSGRSTLSAHQWPIRAESPSNGSCWSRCALRSSELSAHQMGLPAGAEMLCSARVRCPIRLRTSFVSHQEEVHNCTVGETVQKGSLMLSHILPLAVSSTILWLGFSTANLKRVLQDTSLACPQQLALPDDRESYRQRTSPNGRKGSCPSTTSSFRFRSWEGHDIHTDFFGLVNFLRR